MRTIPENNIVTCRLCSIREHGAPPHQRKWTKLEWCTATSGTGTEKFPAALESDFRTFASRRGIKVTLAGASLEVGSTA
jgi:hypothetical protein